MIIPEPQAGLVISYAYLWHHEHRSGRAEGRKDRPCVIVVAVVRAAGSRTLVRVVSITHRPPDKPDSAIELPLKVRQHLGMDDARAWAIVDELNEFAWPGFDLRPVSRNSDRTDFGFLPPRLFDTLISKLRVVWQIGAVKPSRSGLIVNLTPTA